MELANWVLTMWAVKCWSVHWVKERAGGLLDRILSGATQMVWNNSRMDARAIYEVIRFRATRKIVAIVLFLSGFDQAAQVLGMFSWNRDQAAFLLRRLQPWSGVQPAALNELNEDSRKTIQWQCCENGHSRRSPKTAAEIFSTLLRVSREAANGKNQGREPDLAQTSEDSDVVFDNLN